MKAKHALQIVSDASDKATAKKRGKQTTEKKPRKKSAAKGDGKMKI